MPRRPIAHAPRANEHPAGYEHGPRLPAAAHGLPAEEGSDFQLAGAGYIEIEDRYAELADAGLFPADEVNGPARAVDDSSRSVAGEFVDEIGRDELRIEIADLDAGEHQPPATGGKISTEAAGGTRVSSI